MTMLIDNNKFITAHKAFVSWIQQKGDGVPFTGFDHPFLYESEIVYKHKAYLEGNKAITFKKWKGWLNKTGYILKATKDACVPRISSNLLVHQYGSMGNSYGALYRVETEDQIRELESELYAFLLGGSSSLESISERFDRFADYLRERKLGCKWPFIAYLCFLLDPMLYFPVLPGRFQKLINYFDLKIEFAGKVEWNRYISLLNMAELLKEKLSMYGQLNAIQIQSYIYIVASILDRFPELESFEGAIDFQSELERRQKHAAEKERIGLLGEKFVLDLEKKKLIDADRIDLAEKVKLVAIESSSIGYDILSYNNNGTPIHIEVKTTSRKKTLDNGFWLPETERGCAENDPNWVIYRVWSINTSPVCENLGNIILSDTKWEVNPSSWYVSYIDS